MSRKQRKTKDGRHILKNGEYERSRGGFEYKFTDISGARCSISAATLEELRAKEKQVTRANVDGISISRGRQTLNHYYEIWKRQKRGLKARTLNNYIYMYDHFVRDVLGNKPIDRIKHSDIKQFYGKLQDDGVMSVRTMDNLQNVLFQIFSMAVRDDCIRVNPCQDALVELKREAPVEKKSSLTPAEQARLMDACRDTLWYPIFGIMLRTGLRIGELSGLTWDDVDTSAGVIHIRRSLSYYKDHEKGEMLRIIASPKTDAGYRDLPLDSELISLFDLQRQIGNRCDAVVDNVGGFVFGTRFHGTIQQSVVNRAIKRLVISANADAGEDGVLLPDFSCHTLRRTFATNCVRAGVSLPVLMSWMGHRDVATTIGYYVEVQADMSCVANDAVRQYIEDVVNMSRRSDGSKN